MQIVGVYTPNGMGQILSKYEKAAENNLFLHIDLKEIAECRECTCFNLRKATRIVTQIYDDAMRPTGLRATQFALLVHASAMGPVPLTRLAEALATDRTTLARNLELPVKEGLLKIEDGKDRRIRIVNITDSGLKKLAEAYPIWKRTQERIKNMMGIDDWVSMISNLNELVAQMKAK